MCFNFSDHKAEGLKLYFTKQICVSLPPDQRMMEIHLNLFASLDAHMPSSLLYDCKYSKNKKDVDFSASFAGINTVKTLSPIDMVTLGRSKVSVSDMDRLMHLHFFTML